MDQDPGRRPDWGNNKNYNDEFDQLARVVDAAGKVSQFDYSKGRLLHVQDANLNTTTYDYDKLRQLTTVHHPAGPTSAYTYYGDGLLKTKTDGNLDKARLRGLEIESEFYPSAGWKIFGTFTTLQGTSITSGLPVNDIPPLRLTLGTRVWIGKFSAEINGLFQGGKNDPGPAEIAISACRVFSFKANYFWTPFNIYLTVVNLFNAAYVGRPDPEAVEETGRSLVFGLTYSF